MNNDLNIITVLGEEQNLNDALTYLILLASKLRRKSVNFAAETIENVVCEFQKRRNDLNSYSTAEKGYAIPLLITHKHWSAGLDQGYLDSHISLDIEVEAYSTTILAMRQLKDNAKWAIPLRRH